VRAISRVLLTAGIGASLVVLPAAALLGTSNENDGFRLFLGTNQDELARLGSLEYPDEGVEHNRACHRLAARLTADRYGVIATLLGGVANEVVEATTQALMGQDPLRRDNIDETLGDLAANWRGVRDSIKETFRQVRGGGRPGARRPSYSTGTNLKSS
jgi:hypothetical protein